MQQICFITSSNLCGITVQNQPRRHGLRDNYGRAAVQDVVLINWFKDSPAGSKLRCVYAYMASRRWVPPGRDVVPQHSAFDPERHHVLLSELLQLYSLITSVKRSLIILEDR